MKNSEFKIQNFQYLFCILLFAFCITAVKAQSINSAFPTAVSANEINGTIPARDIGDARLTSYYYTFNGAQGDIFINVTATNFNGDVEIFVAEGLRSLSKISMFADSPVNETGRVIYLRKPERLILRVQGRTPDDNPARFTIKFAGSFVAVQSSGEAEEPALPEVRTQDSGGIRVNSVGTIIEVTPKTTPDALETVAEKAQPDSPEENPERVAQTDLDKTPERATDAEKVSEEIEAAAEKAPAKKPAPRPARRTARTTTPPKAAEPKEVPPDPMANIHLRVLMKDGKELDFPMTEVFRFSMNNGILIITMKDGKIHRYPILDTQRIIIE
jgi:hypothetical protein